MTPPLAVVVPTLDEADRLPGLLADLSRLPASTRIVVADGGSGDGTGRIAREAGVTLLRAPRGRARQIRAGVEATEEPWILLLHADSRLPHESARALLRWLGSAEPADSAHFAFRLQGGRWSWRWVERGQRLRERLFGLVYGDQGLVLSRETWRRIGGVPDIPLMEDVALVDRLRRHGRVHRLPAPLLTSPRRYEAEGPVRAVLRNVLLMALYRSGVDPARLAGFYPDRPDRADRPSATVVAFARAPRAGEVKTRLAAEVGHASATRLYRSMAESIVGRLRNGSWRLAVAYTPEDAEEEVREWLGEGIELWPQTGSDLGTRMERALTRALDATDRACVVGTDVPDLDRETVAQALSALDRHDLVVGPAEDGGYYLLALRRVHPELFRDVPWSTSGVLDLTLRRAAELGLRVRRLRPLPDVDTLSDVPERLRSRLEG